MSYSPIEQSILYTLAYTTVFDFPLTLKELFQRQINFTSTPYSFTQLKHSVQDLCQKEIITCRKDFFTFSYLPHLVEKRRQRELWSVLKKKEVCRYVPYFHWIPNIKAVYLTGSLAMDNVSTIHDDIDIMIVTAENQLWLTRLLVIGLFSILGKYRLHDESGDDSWCFNLWLDESSLSLPTDQQSLYTAYEVIQSKLIWGNENDLLTSNPWLVRYLPVWKGGSTRSQQNPGKRKESKLVNWLCYSLQTLYMSKRKTREKVTLHSAFFHPRNTEDFVQDRFDKICQSLGLPKLKMGSV